MRKFKIVLCVFFVLSIMVFAVSCNKSKSPAQPTIEKLRIAYVPSIDAQVLLAATEPLKQLLIGELAKQGFSVGEVEITVGTSFEAVGEALASGSVDIGIGGASVYITYEDEVDLLLTATRNDFNKDGTDPKLWNTGITERIDGKVTVGYRGLIYAGPSAYGKTLAAKVESGQALSWEDLNKATWAVANTTSNAGYLYPCLWLKNNYGKMFGDLAKVIPGTNYPTMFTQAASEQIDIFMVFADGRMDYVTQWNADMGRKASIWDEVKVIGVTEMIMNDVTMGSKESETMRLPGFKDAYCKAIMAISGTPEGRQAINVLGHTGYVIGEDADYDSLREVQDVLRSLN